MSVMDLWNDGGESLSSSASYDHLVGNEIDVVLCSPADAEID